MSIEVLVSTMNSDENIIDKMNISSACTVINQCNEEQYTVKMHNEKKIKFISNMDRGLSKSRNLAINNSEEEILVIADDDLIYVDNYEEIIEEQYKRNPKYDIIVFQVEGINKKFKNYYKYERELGYLTSMKVSSVEITLKRESIIKSGINFNELLGSGAKYSMGEENTFLFECLKKGLKIKYVPVKIADLNIGQSTWFKGFNEKYFFDRGAVFTAMTKKLYLILIFQFAIRHWRLCKEQIGIIKSIKFMIQGHKSYKNDLIKMTNEAINSR